jgi:hypothetical protein
MQFKRVNILITHSLTMSTTAVVFEHEVPIYEARFGSQNIEHLPDDPLSGLAMVDEDTGERDEHNYPIKKKVPMDVTLEEEWERLMTRPAKIQVGEQDVRPAPMVAYPRGVLDLEDFYRRLRGSNVVNLQDDRTFDPPEQIAAEPEKPEEAVKKLSERDLIKRKLDFMGIEYKGNAKTTDLQALLDEVTDGSTDLQNEG